MSYHSSTEHDHSVGVKPSVALNHFSPNDLEAVFARNDLNVSLNRYTGYLN